MAKLNLSAARRRNVFNMCTRASNVLNVCIHALLWVFFLHVCHGNLREFLPFSTLFLGIISITLC